MQICKANHVEVCFEGNNCPVCDEMEKSKREAREQETIYLERIEKLEDEISESY